MSIEIVFSPVVVSWVRTCLIWTKVSYIRLIDVPVHAALVAVQIRT
jgi:hypothetical protein